MINYFRKVNIAIAFVILSALNFSAVTPEGNFAVLANPQAGVTNMKYSEFISIMKGEKSYWKNGNKVSIALLKTSTKAGEAIAKSVYGMTGDELNKYWLSLVFQGKAAAPFFFDTESDLKSFVARTNGAIGIITAESVDDNDKCVLIDGKKFIENP